MNRYIMTDGAKSIDLPQFPNEAWHFYEGEPEEKEDFYAKVSAVFRAVNLTASATANIPFALVKKSGKDFDISSEWENKVGFMPKPNELIRLWRMSLCMTNKAYGFMENSKATGKNLRYIVPTTITPIVDKSGLQGFKRTIGNATEIYPLDSKCPIFWMWRMDHTTELLPAKATEFQAMMAAAGILYYSDSFIQAFFKRGGIKPTMLVLKGMTNRENVEKIENVWDKIIRGGYKYLGKIFQGVDANGGLEAQTIGEGVDNLKDETLTDAKIADIAMSVGMPLSLLLSNSATYATAMVEYKSWYENALAPWCSFMAEEMTDKLFKPLNLRFEFRPEMTDPGQEDEVARASAYSTYVNAGIKPSIAAQVIGMELPQGIEFEALDQMQEEKQQQAIEIMQEKQSSSDDEEKPDAVQKEKVTKFVPNLDQLKEMDIWRKFAFRHFKKGEPLTFAFEVKTLPDDIAEGIRCGLEVADSEDAIKQAFDIDAVEPVETKSDYAILELADAINKACDRAVELVPEVKAHLSDKALEVLKSIGTYDRQLWKYCLALYRTGDGGTFLNQFIAAISNQITRAWNEGAREVGVEPEEMTDTDKAELKAVIDSEYDHVLDLGEAIIMSRNGTMEEFRQQFRPRVDLWVARYNDAANRAKVYFGGRQRLVWTLGATEEHCETCAALNGIVAFADEWEQSGIRPQSPPNEILACGGWQCDCSLELTDKRRSPDALGRLMDIATAANI
jgi:hypothetical protein